MGVETARPASQLYLQYIVRAYDMDWDDLDAPKTRA